MIIRRDQTLVPPATDPCRVRLGAPAYSLPLLREIEALSSHHGLLTLSPTPHVPPATALRRTRLEAAAYSLLLLQEAEALNTHHGLITPLLPLLAQALTQATTPRSRI